MEDKSEKVKTNCPDNGTCTFEVLKDKNLEVLKDGIGELYPKIMEGDKVVLKFEYKRNEIPNTVDGNYSEIIYLELNTSTIGMELENDNLQNVKLLFARLCFCRGQTGYYKIRNGALSIKKEDKNSYRLKLSFKTFEVPQVISTIEEIIVLE